MQAHLRLAKLKEPAVQIVNSYIISSNKPLTVKICPIPHFLKDAKCKCGKEAKIVFNDAGCACLECLNKMFEGTTEMVTIKDVSVPLTRRTIINIKFEWSVDGERWYTVYGRNLVTKDWNALIEKIKNMIVRDISVLLNADYDREKKQLKIS